MNLNHILLFLAIVSPLLVLARAWRPSSPHYGWGIPGLLVLLITGVAWLVWPRFSGYVGGAAWFFLLFLPAIALRKITQLADHGDYESAERLGTALQILHPTAELREQVRLFRRLKSSTTRSRAFRSVRVEQRMTPSGWLTELRSAPAVLTLVLINIFVFLFEMYRGGWNNPLVLHRIGALEPLLVVRRHEYWRLFTALFLHAGYLHIGFNLLALYIIGPPLERSLGTIRFLACYLGSGVASSAGVVALTQMGLMRDAQTIGASGCILGLIGAWAGLLLRHHDAPLAKQRLANIGLIILVQVAFDLSTPEVSMSAHLGGVIAGFFLGLILAPRALASDNVDNARRY